MDSSFHFISKVFWLLCSPDKMLTLLLVLCLILFWFRSKKAMLMLTAVVAAVVILSVVPVGKWALYPLESRFPSVTHLPHSVDGVIVLGGAERLGLSAYWNQPETNTHAERLFSFIHLIRLYPAARHVYTGGSSGIDPDLPTASNVVRKLLETQGVPVEPIIFEAASRNTYENGINTKKRVNPSPGEVWLLITSALHMPRAVGVFNHAGWPVIPYPVDHQVNPDRLFKPQLSLLANLRDLNAAAHEWIGLAAYFFTGKTNRLFPGP